jgi:hypothetical protein
LENPARGALAMTPIAQSEFRMPHIPLNRLSPRDVQNPRGCCLVIDRVVMNFEPLHPGLVEILILKGSPCRVGKMSSASFAAISVCRCSAVAKSIAS